MLDLDVLSVGAIPGISGRMGASLAEAAGVCLESQGHRSGAQLTIRGYSNRHYILNWPEITEQSRKTWADTNVATENGAAAIAVLLAERELGYTVIQRSSTGTGFDYWLGNRSDALPMQEMARLEVSGIRRGNDLDVRARVRRKLVQTDRSDATLLPAYVIVVEFGRPLAEVREK